MATYSLSGSGTQTLTANVVALHVTISTLPAGAGHGLANPTDYWGIGSVRPGNAAAFWDPFVICGGPQWLPVPYGTTRLGYSFTTGAAVSVAEVFTPAPLVFPLAFLPDVAVLAPTDGQVLTYQASTAKWINAAPASGGGAATSISAAVTRSTALAVTSGTAPTVTFDVEQWDTDTMFTSSASDRLTIRTAGKYLVNWGGRWEEASNGARINELRKNNIKACEHVLPMSTTGTFYASHAQSYMLDCAVNDYLSVIVYQDTGVSRNFGHSTYQKAYLQAFRIG